MTDKCASHDECIGRIRDNLDGFRDELHQGIGEIKEMLHDGAIIHTKLIMRLEHQENEIRECWAEIVKMKEEYHGVNWKDRAVGMCLGLLEKLIVVIGAMAYWAHTKGWGSSP